MSADNMSERFDLTGQVAISGGGRGIGRAMALALAQAGAALSGCRRERATVARARS